MQVKKDFSPLYESISDYLYNMSALTRREARQKWRQSIKDAWNNRCAYCGKPPIDDESLTMDHVRPRSSGGEDRTSNCIPACRECNQSKSSKLWIEWFREQPFYNIESEWRIKQWLAGGIRRFSEYDEEDSKVVSEYAKRFIGLWPTGRKG